MSLVTNAARTRLAAGEVALGVGVRLSRSIEIASLMQSAGYDWLLLDLEHGTIPLDTAAQISIAALAVGIAPIVRVPQDDYATAARAIDGGALGIIMPHVDTAEQAATAVAHMKYPPLGHLSAGGALPQNGFNAVRGSDAARQMNETLLMTVMLETRRAIENADAIAAVTGVDVVMIGTNDLMMEMGISNEPGHAWINRAYESLIAACTKNGKWAGVGGVHQDDVLRRYIGMGSRFVLTTTDLSLLVGRAAQRAELLRGFK